MLISDKSTGTVKEQIDLFVVSDPCASEPCQNGATCSANSDGTYSCACLQGWSGKNCDECEQFKLHCLILNMK